MPAASGRDLGLPLPLAFSLFLVLFVLHVREFVHRSWARSDLDSS